MNPTRSQVEEVLCVLYLIAASLVHARWLATICYVAAVFNLATAWTCAIIDRKKVKA